MLVYAGIDEAGYGPLLGPLCVGCSVFVLDGHNAMSADSRQPPADSRAAPNLWKTLSKVVCRKGRDSRRRIAIEDSKKLKGANSSVKVHPLTHLERGVLAFCAAARHSREGGNPERAPTPPGPPPIDPAHAPPPLDARLRGHDGSGRTLDVEAPSHAELPLTDADLFARIGAALPPSSWYQSMTNLPLAHTADQLRIASSRLCRGLDEASVKCAGIACEAIHPDDFNRQVAKTNNKASVNFAAAMRLVDRIWRRWPVAGPDHPRVILDRHGGRTRYREELQMCWPEAHIQIIAEDEAICRYRLTRSGTGGGGPMLTVTFMPDAEEKHLPVALASMTAKYVRELFMLRLNRFFAQHLPELKPTAGYYGDAQRYLDAIEPVMSRLNLAKADIVRCF